MIKRFRFVSRSAGVSPQEFSAAWPAELARLRARASAPLRASRVVACTMLPDLLDAPHDGICIEWFERPEALRRFETAGCASGLGAVDASFVAEEHILRGADWLTRRWHAGGTKLKHMALARRAAGLSAATFSARWKRHAGAAGAIAIPDVARGAAYVQNHALDGGGRYDAVNEVYFEESAALHQRIAFFAAHDVGRSSAELVSEATFIAVTEHVL